VCVCVCVQYLSFVVYSLFLSLARIHSIFTLSIYIALVQCCAQLWPSTVEVVVQSNRDCNITVIFIKYYFYYNCFHTQYVCIVYRLNKVKFNCLKREQHCPRVGCEFSNLSLWNVIFSTKPFHIGTPTMCPAVITGNISRWCTLWTSEWNANMVRSRFLGKPPRTRCPRTMVQVGVSDFVDNEAKNARMISIAFDVFRTTLKNDGEVSSFWNNGSVCSY
jgi:hypothetical protein